MPIRQGREAIRGAEEETIDLIAQGLTSEERAELLGAPLERAAAKGNRRLTKMASEEVALGTPSVALRRVPTPMETDRVRRRCW